MGQIFNNAKQKVFTGDKSYLTERILNNDFSGVVNDIKDIAKAKMRKMVNAEKEKIKQAF